MILKTSNPNRPPIRTGLLFLLLITPLLTGCGSSADARKPSEPKPEQTEEPGSTVPFTLTERKFIKTDIRVNDHDPATFLFFPTFSRSVLFRGKPEDKGSIQLENDDSSDTRKITVDRLQIGSFSVRNPDMLHLKRKEVRKLSVLLRKQNLTSYAGILGQNVLRDTELTIHYPEQKLHLRPAERRSKKTNGASLAPGKLTYRMSEATVRRKLLIIQAGINGRYKGQFALMPGMPVSLIDQSSIQKWNLSLLSTEKLRSTYGLPSSKYDFLEIERLWCRGRTFQNVLFRVNDRLKQNMSLNAEGVLGYLFFKDKILQINFPRRWVIVKKPE